MLSRLKVSCGKMLFVLFSLYSLIWCQTYESLNKYLVNEYPADFPILLSQVTQCNVEGKELTRTGVPGQEVPSSYRISSNILILLSSKVQNNPELLLELSHQSSLRQRRLRQPPWRPGAEAQIHPSSSRIKSL